MLIHEILFPSFGSLVNVDCARGHASEPRDCAILAIAAPVMSVSAPGMFER